jgi:hypothetical protein
LRETRSWFVPVSGRLRQWKVTDLTVFTLDALYGSAKGAVKPGESASWAAIVGYARLGLGDAFAFCLRAE